ncbi:cuticle protein 8-like [Varroa destructor]|uniref:Uncharacterized protein n=2 Tax=Varroa TaxID=62624 RepID=A0A7M7JSM2_VARDE|nr:cuticle protein 8-like [Varroa destructor]
MPGLVALAFDQVRTSFTSPYATYTTDYNPDGSHYHPRHNDARHAYNHAYGRYEAYAILPYDFRHDHSRRAYIANGHYRPETSHRNNYHRYGGYGYPYNNYYYGYTPYGTVARYIPPIFNAAISSPLTARTVESSRVTTQPVVTIPRTSRKFEVRSATPTPYHFVYLINGADGAQIRQESGDGASHINGAYSFVLPDGRQRRVEYVADEDGFRAKVDTNEPGTESQNPAAVLLRSNAIPAAEAAILSDLYSYRYKRQ